MNQCTCSVGRFHFTSLQSYRLLPVFVIFVLLNLLPSLAFANPSEAFCLTPEGAQRLYGWFSPLAKEADETLADFDMQAKRHKALVTFDDANKPSLVFLPTEEKNTLAAGSLFLRFEGLTKAQETALTRLMRAARPPAVFTPCEVISTKSNAQQGRLAQNPQETFMLLPLVLLPLALFLLWGGRLLPFFKRPTPKRRLFRWTFLLFSVYLIVLHIMNMDGFRRFDIDAERDLAAFTLVAKGEMLPLKGPAIAAGGLRNGALYFAIGGIVTWLTDAPEALYAVNTLSMLLAMFIAAALIFHLFGLLPSALFMALWAGLLLPLLNVGVISHNYWAFPFIAAAILASTQMRAFKSTTLFPFAVLSLSIAVELYAIFAALFLSLLLALLLRGLWPSFKQWLYAAFAFMLTNALTLWFFLEKLIKKGGVRFADPQTNDPISDEHFYARLLDLFFGAYPAEESLVMIGSIGLIAFLGMWLWRRVKRNDEGAHLLETILLFLLVPLPFALMTKENFLDCYGVVFLPAAPMATGLGLAFLFRVIPLPKLDKLTPFLLVGFVSALSFTAYSRGWLPSRAHYESGIDIREQERIARELAARCIQTPKDFATCTHGELLYTESLGLRFLTHSLGKKENAPCEKKPHALLMRPFGKDAEKPSVSLRFFTSVLDYDNLSLQAEPSAVKPLKIKRFRLPKRPRHFPHPLRNYYGEKARLPFVAPELNERLSKGEIQLRIPLKPRKESTSLFVLVDMGCRYSLEIDGKALRLKSERKGSEKFPINKKVYTLMPYGKTLLFKANAEHCSLKFLDIFALAKETDSPK